MIACHNVMTARERGYESRCCGWRVTLLLRVIAESPSPPQEPDECCVNKASVRLAMRVASQQETQSVGVVIWPFDVSLA